MSDTGPNLGIERFLDVPYDEAVAKTRAALQKEGFGVLTEIDVKSTLKEKIDVDFRRYIILGACSPPLAHRALGEIVAPAAKILLPNLTGFADGGIHTLLGVSLE